MDPRLEFNKPIIEIEQKILELKTFSEEKDVDLTDEISRLETKKEEKIKEVYSNLTSWQQVEIARHINRPYTYDYIRMLFTDFVEIHGDRNFRDDKAVVGGFAKINGIKVMVIGQQKGRDLKERQLRNFGMPHPEGYRKAMRLARMAEKFNLPLVVFIDTPGAFPGIGSEERGIAEAIAYNQREFFTLKIPIVVLITGEGMSGGALGMSVGDYVFMLENAIYSVISPEGCAAILWKKAERRKDAAEALRLTSSENLKFGIADEIIPEPVGGAHEDYEATAENMHGPVVKALKKLMKLSPEKLLENRYKKFRAYGQFEETSDDASKENN